MACADDCEEFGGRRRGIGGRGSDSAGVRALGFADVFAAVSGRGILVVSCDDAQAKVPEEPAAEGVELMIQVILQFGRPMFCGRAITARFFVRAGWFARRAGGFVALLSNGGRALCLRDCCELRGMRGWRQVA